MITQTRKIRAEIEKTAGKSLTLMKRIGGKIVFGKLNPHGRQSEKRLL